MLFLQWKYLKVPDTRVTLYTQFGTSGQKCVVPRNEIAHRKMKDYIVTTT